MKRLLFFAFLLFFTFSFAFTYDFGLLLEEKLEAENDLFTYTAGFTPWFSWNNGEDLSFYLSALFSLKYSKYSGSAGSDSEWEFIPELSLFALNYRINQNMSLEAGRIIYSDILGFTAYGFFDGFRLQMKASKGDLSTSFFYTGLLYKETAKIIMTGGDAADYAKAWDIDNFSDYFASKRVFAAVRYDMPVGEMQTLSAELIAQFDVTGNKQTLNSQYGAILIDFFPKDMMKVTAGALFETMQNDNGDFALAFGALGKLKMDLPVTPLNDSLEVTVKLTTGSTDDAFASFIPISSVVQGMIFPYSIAGLAIVGADYSVRLLETLYAQASLNYFIRTYDDPSIDGNLFGAEVWTNVFWQPYDDLRATLGAGIFLPGLGNAFPSGTDAMWKISVGVILSL